MSGSNGGNWFEGFNRREMAEAAQSPDSGYRSFARLVEHIGPHLQDWVDAETAAGASVDDVIFAVTNQYACQLASIILAAPRSAEREAGVVDAAVRFVRSMTPLYLKRLRDEMRKRETKEER